MNNAEYIADTDHCWWDHTRARWVPAERPVVDVRDMVVVHTALLREFRLAPAAVGRVPAGARRAAVRVDRHLGLLCDLLHHHHAGEDELLWPPLRAQAPARSGVLLAEAEAQHEGLDAALGSVADARRAWVERAELDARDALVEALRELHRLLAEHLDTEERTLLPLAAAHLTEAQWRAVGEAGAAAVPASAMLLVFGMFAYEGDPEVLAGMLADAPAPVRALVPRLAPRVYARRAARVHGTARP
ncbi:hypothetical protein Acsp06_63340 [Actinomycetospora sp. NBRC 106375]|uniref:hemerythrin domain-containing protein n=1 Tax=Actinomycetospora sp. NBRC 106375 TaxID=3032207 RepID=UPI0024A4FA25|nr:hemerythrin domain-containing protein [Actinomycetospora sp. NBRC 106375]GLZ50149.1 hypothetical protein Acsp06_63340 [Actinomycetospora sp. NBRC 106375]